MMLRQIWWLIRNLNLTVIGGEGGFCCSLIGDKLFEWLNPPLHLLIFSIIKILDIGKKSVD